MNDRMLLEPPVLTVRTCMEVTVETLFMETAVQCTLYNLYRSLDKN